MILADAGVARLERWWSEGRLVRPRADRADIVALVQAIAWRMGDARHGDRAQAEALLPATPVILFLLIDGLGSALLERYAPDGFLAAHRRQDLDTVFPSTTAVALTSFATATHPAMHGVPGWFAWVQELGLSIEVLPFQERFSKLPLSHWGARPEVTFGPPSILPAFACPQQVVTRSYICQSTYSRYWCGDCPSLGYDRIEDGIALAIAQAQAAAARGGGFVHCYLNHLDSLCHAQGIGAPEVEALIRRLDALCAQVREALPASVTVVICADHGHIDAGADLTLGPGDRLLDFLVCPPTGEPRVPIFHLRRDADPDAFAAAFAAAFGATFVLLPRAAVARLGLLGPAPLSPRAAARFGDFLAIASDHATLRYLAPGHDGHRHRGVHAGMTAAEMRVPLVVA